MTPPEDESQESLALRPEDVSTDGHTLKIAGTEVECCCEIEEYLVTLDYVLVNLDPLKCGERNIEAYDPEGTRVWKIEPGPRKQDISYTSIHRSEEGDLIAVNWRHKYELDLKDGSVTHLTSFK